jgi:hypothetical protein
MSEKAAFHEDFRRGAAVEAASERSFGLTFAAVFLVVAVWPLWSGGGARAWALAAALGCAGLALLRPAALRPLNRAWARLGLLLHRMVSPVVMAFLFYGVVTPTALLMRLFGKNPLRLGFERESRSYWIAREPPGPEPETMRHQF